jgi:acyl-CoA reductase-like NAD-dependent aldehyde dehydrogenase
MARKLFLEGKWQDGVSSSTVRSPWDQRVLETVAQASKAQVERAVLFAQTGASRLQRLSSGQRREVLRRIAQGLVSHAQELAQVISAEAGKPITAARAEVARAIETFELAAAELSTFGGGVVPVDLTANAVGAEAEVRRFPAGVVVGIVPFNFPLNLGAHKVAPALAVGAPIIIKPPPQAPSAMLLLAELAQAAGADPAALQVLPCENSVAEALATDPRVRVVSFTGSARVGWHLKSVVKGKCVLELGGNAAAIVCADADLAQAAQRLAMGAFVYSGQVCIKAQRIIVEAPAWEGFSTRFLAEVKTLAQGDPSREDTVIGPVIDEHSAQRIEAWVNDAVAGGATALLTAPREGTRVRPVVLTDVARFSKVYSEEVFGPVVVLEQVADFGAALDAANDSAFGLQAGLFTNDLKKVRRAFHELEVGGVIVNDAPSFRSDNMPYGGLKQSGLGREGVRYAMADFTEERVLVYR